MTNSNNDIEELEELLTELEGQEAQLVSTYSEDDDAVTQLMDAPLGDQEWMVQVTPLDRRMMSTDQLVSEFHGGRLSDKTLVWRGGMDDWLPIQRVEELVTAPRTAPTLASRMAMGLPPPPAARPASQPLWSMPANAPVATGPLPPPPAAMPPVAMMPSATTSNMGLPKPSSMATPSAPEPMSHNTTRPVSLDFNDMPPPEAMSPVQGKRALVALGAVGIMAVFVTFYALSSGGDAKPSAEMPMAAPQAVAALQPAPAKATEPPPTPAKVEAAPSEPAASETASASNETQQKSTAPARYSLRSEYRKRSRGSSSSDSSRSDEPSKDKDDTEQRATPAASRATASNDEPSSSEPEPAADDDADSDVAPKSTGKGANTFNREAAKSALDAAAIQAKNCKPPGGPVGSGRVQVRYEPSGKVALVQLLTGKFNNTTTGSCVQMVFRRAKVPEFTGVPAVVVSKSFEIP